jgi:GTP pyrophosphokinase
MVSSTRVPPSEADFQVWLDRLGTTRSGQGLGLLASAFDLASNGEGKAEPCPVLARALAIADILEQLGLDTDILAVPLLCAALETGRASQDTISKHFPPKLGDLVADVYRLEAAGTLLPRDGLHPDSDQLEALRKLLLSVARDIRVVLVKLAERLHTLRHLDDAAPEEQKRFAQETRDIYAALANRLGIAQMKWELEDLSLRYLEPDTYRTLAKSLDQRRADREAYIQRLVDRLHSEFRRAGIDANVYGRAKHLFSIWRKMQRKRLRFDELYDVRAVRVLVDSVKDCYGALGVVHALWTPIKREFDDYIANPKQNGYQSLHTAVLGPEGRTVEVQIRTQAMHESAELGVAAHWRYKEGDQGKHGVFEEKIAWLRQLLETGEDGDGDLLDRFQAEALVERVYVVTPKGQVLDLPRGATPLDFAYKLHSDVGHRCRGAKVDGRIVPLTYALNNGERVEVLTAKQGAPSRDWLNPNLGFLKSGRARSKVRQWFRQADQINNTAAGRASVEREFARLGLRGISLQKVAERLKVESVDQLLAAVGFGDITLPQVVGAAQEQAPAFPAERFVHRPKRRQGEAGDGAVQVRGVGNLMTHLAQCCRPVRPERIVGYITLGRGVTIHRADCRNVLNLQARQPDRIIEVDWGLGEEGNYSVDLQIVAYDRAGLLRDITTLLAKEEANVISLSTTTDTQESTARMQLAIEVRDMAHLARIVDRLGQLPNVQQASRLH